MRRLKLVYRRHRFGNSRLRWSAGDSRAIDIFVASPKYESRNKVCPAPLATLISQKNGATTLISGG
ncbi:hypothetical protein CSC43_1328 [Pseudomonas aeruginosa]|nr:hypothetical protein CSC43_1328 [Pseudomonas aeruginosa]